MARVTKSLLAVALVTVACGCRPGGNGGPAPVTSVTAAAPVGVCFENVAKEAGLRYEWKPSGNPPYGILQTIGNGAAFLDINGDRNLDLLLVGPHPALFQGDGKGHFVDITVSSGLSKIAGHFLGCATGDVNNDGQTDIYLTGYREGRLLINRGGTLTDASTRSGLSPQPWGTSAAFADVDNDGDLDLYVGNYAVFGPTTSPQLCVANGVKTSCGPREYEPIKGTLYEGDGTGKFRDITRKWNALDISGKTLGVAFADYDNSGRPSLYLANDEMPGDLLRNTGMKFETVGAVAGVAYDSSGNLHGGMGTDWGDFDNDGKLDLFVATFQNEVKNVYHNDDGVTFTDRAMSLGMSAAVPMVAFGSKFVDFDNDGLLDICIANGHVQDNIAVIDKSMTFRQPIQLFRNAGSAGYTDMSLSLGDVTKRTIVGRGLATGDYDNDGKVDILAVDSVGKPVLLHNQVPTAHSWIGFMVSQPAGLRDATGTKITIRAGTDSLTRFVHTDGSYMSASDPRVHVGLGSRSAIDSVVVVWPDKKTDTYSNLGLNRYWRVSRGSPPR